MEKWSGLLPCLIGLLALTGCSGAKAREYELKGQVLAVDAARRQVTIRHEDIPRFMPAMTMPFEVRDAALLDGREPGELVTATLVVEDAGAHLRDIERIGFAPLPEEAAPPAPLRQPGEPVEDAAFVNQDGEPRRLGDWRGHVLAVTFMYTRCPVPNFCPLMDRHFRAAQAQIRADGDLKGTARLLSVTLDPAHDTPAVLAAHAATLEADREIWEFLTAPDGTAFAAQFGVSTFRDDPQGTEVMHNLRTAIIDGDGRLVTVLNGNEWTPPDLIRALQQARADRAR